MSPVSLRFSPQKQGSESELGEDVQTKARNAHEKARLPQLGPQSTPEQGSLTEINPGSSQGSLVPPEKLMLNRPENLGWLREHQRAHTESVSFSH